MKGPVKQELIDKYMEHLRILLVEDSLPVQRMIRAVLKDIGVGDVVVASDGKAALEVIDDSEVRIGMIISDWHMPNMTGIELLRTLRANGKNIPFLMVSSDVSREAVTAAAAAGVSGYIRKPFSQKQLADKLALLATACA